MSIQKCLEEMKSIQNNLIEFLNDETKESFDYIISSVKNNFDKYKLKSFLHLLTIISCNYKRGPNFFTKIEKILIIFKDDIKSYYSNMEIFQIFKNNKRILLFLLEENIMIIDKYVAKNMINGKFLEYDYPLYFAPEMKPYISEKWFNNKKLKEKIMANQPDNFNELRKAGENESLVCQMIQKDSIIEFISYVNKNNYSLNSIIEPSIYETNSFLLKKRKLDKSFYLTLYLQSNGRTSLIEYAAFYGSIQIFNYLRNNGVELTQSLWINAIHSGNAELIHLLEENHVELKDKTYKIYIRESIKNHQNDIAKYFLNNYLQNEKDDFKYLCEFGIKYYNYDFIDNKMINEESFYYLCKYDHYAFANTLLNDSNIDIDINRYFEEKGDELRWSKLINFNGSSVDTIILYGKIKRTPLFVAVEKENIDIIKILLANEEINVNCMHQENDGTWGGSSVMFSGTSQNKTPLFVAVEKENLEIIKLLLANKEIDVNYGENERSWSDGGDHVSWEGTPLYKAVENENIEIIKLLYSNDKIDPNIPIDLYADWQGGGQKGEGNTMKSVLYTALKKENIEIIKFLLADDKINVNFINTNIVYGKCLWKETALHFAVVHYTNNKDIIGLLLNHKNIDLNIKNENGKKPIDCCDIEEIRQMLNK